MLPLPWTVACEDGGTFDSGVSEIQRGEGHFQNCTSNTYKLLNELIPMWESTIGDSIPETWLRPLEVPSDSVYPREYTDGNGFQSYRKMWKGVYVFSNNYSGAPWDEQISRIDFFDSLGRKLSHFDVRDHNPYLEEAVSELEEDKYQKFMFDRFIPKTVTVDKKEYEPTFHYIYTQIPSSHSIPVVGFHRLGAIKWAVTDWTFSAICLDEQGNILRMFTDLDIDPYEFCVSENKKFFCVAYGGLRGESLTQLRNSGFRIYEIETGDMVYEIEAGNKNDISAGCDCSFEERVFGGFNIGGNDFSDDRSGTYFMIDFDNRAIYKRMFSYDERKFIVGGDREGFHMEDPVTRRRWKLLFTEEFDVEKF